MVYTEETIGKNAEGVLAVYIYTGKDAGIYQEIGGSQIDEWCSEIANAVDNK